MSDYENAHIVSWMKCGNFEVSSPDWPASHAGTTVVWSEPQYGEIVVIGYFIVYFEEPGSLTIAPHPLYNTVRLLDSNGVFDDVTEVGLAGFGGTPGFNPTGPQAVKPVTWGKIKAQYLSRTSATGAGLARAAGPLRSRPSPSRR